MSDINYKQTGITSAARGAGTGTATGSMHLRATAAAARQADQFDMTTGPIEDIDFDYAISTAGRALQLMAQNKVPATPRNFEIWFTFASGTSPELNKTINILIANKRGFDSATNRSLFLTYIGAEEDWNAKHGETSEQLHNVLSSARGFLATAMTENRDQVEALGGVASQIDADTDPRLIIEGLVGEVSKAVTRALNLEAHFNASLQELDKIRSHLAAAEQRSKTDALTGLANRLALDEFLRGAQLRAMESGQALSIFLIDVDHFKAFNDKFGHQFGDQVLRLVSKVLKDSLRSQDLAARYGGEELVGVLPEVDLRDCKAVAERIRQTIANRRITRRATGEVLSNITVSIGIAQFVLGETLANLFDRCDRALYAAKRAGRNRTVTELELGGDIVAA
jgi:diguanylate cyclase